MNFTEHVKVGDDAVHNGSYILHRTYTGDVIVHDHANDNYAWNVTFAIFLSIPYLFMIWRICVHARKWARREHEALMERHAATRRAVAEQELAMQELPPAYCDVVPGGTNNAAESNLSENDGSSEDPPYLVSDHGISEIASDHSGTNVENNMEHEDDDSEVNADPENATSLGQASVDGSDEYWDAETAV